MNGYAQHFLQAKDRLGRPLYPNARMIVEHDGLALVEWSSVCSEDEEPVLHRTWIDHLDGAMAPGIFGDAQHVYGIMEKRAHKNMLSAQRNARRILREICESSQASRSVDSTIDQGESHVAFVE